MSISLITNIYTTRLIFVIPGPIKPGGPARCSNTGPGLDTIHPIAAEDSIMSSSVSHPGPVMHDFGDSPEDEWLRGLNRQQLADRLTWLSWWSPGAFQAVMDYMEFIDNLAADGHPGQDSPDDLAPYCLACGSELGIFTGSGVLDWKHYRVTSQAGIERFDPDHAPEVGWRPAITAPA